MAREPGVMYRWKKLGGGGAIRRDDGSPISFFYEDCSQGLKDILDQHDIPPGELRVTFVSGFENTDEVAKNVFLATEIVP